MTLRLHPLWACVVVGCIAALTARPAFAAPTAPNDAAALKMRDEAIDTDYLATNFADAAAKLQKALTLCKAATSCSSAVRARLLCDLGVIDFTMKREDDSRAHFAAALKEDPNVTLDKDLSSTDVQREFAAAKAGGAGPAAPEAPGAAPASPGAKGDMAHAPITSQAFLTPIPIYVELPEGVTATKVYVRYKAPGQTEWKTARMTKRGNGFGTEIPCMDVGDSVGDLKYFVQATDASGDIVASTGRMAEPYTVRIVAHVEGEAPHLPDRPPPTACSAASDCPPGFPGCHSTTTKSSSAEACVSDDECSGGQTCVDGECGGSEGGSAEAEEHVPIKRNWLSVGVEADGLLLPSASNACAGGSGYTCFSDNGSYYADNPLANADNLVNGGFTLATERVLFGYDRVVWDNVTLGARLGFALGGGPERPGGTAFMPVHAEARAAYWFGTTPFARSGFRFFVLAAGGMAEVDASVPVDVFANATAYQAKTSQDERAWKKAGQGFAALGGGTMYAITPSSGIVLEAKIVEMLPTSATGIGLQLGYLVGL